MKKFLLTMALICGSILASSAHAQDGADAFKGWYKILGQSGYHNAFENQYLFVDADTLENIWNNDIGSTLPDDLKEYKDVPCILAAFTNRDTVFLTFQKNIVVRPGYLLVPGVDGDLLEMALRSDGNFDMGVREKSVVSRYLLAPPVNDPDYKSVASLHINR